MLKTLFTIGLTLGAQISNGPQMAWNTPFDDTFIVSTEENPFYYSAETSGQFFNSLIPIVNNGNYNKGNNIYFNAIKLSEQLTPFGGWLTYVTGSGSATFIDSVTQESRTVSFSDTQFDVWDNGINYASATMRASVSFYTPISMNLAGQFGISYRAALQPAKKNGGRLLPSFKPFYTVRRDSEPFTKPALFYTQNKAYPDFVYWSLNYDGYNLQFEGSDGSTKTFYPQLSPNGESFIYYPVDFQNDGSMRVRGVTYGTDTAEVANELFYFGDYFGGYEATLNPVHAYQAYTKVGYVPFIDFAFTSNGKSFQGIAVSKADDVFKISYYGVNGYTDVFKGKTPSISANRVSFSEIEVQEEYTSIYVPFQRVDTTYFSDQSRFTASAVFGGNDYNYYDLIKVYEGYNVFNLLGKAFTGVGGFFVIQVLPGITLGTVMLVPLFVAIILFVVELFKR